MILELSDDYLPEEVLHRDKQITEIKEIFKNFKKLGMGTNLILFGVTGSGKTTIIKKVIQDEDNSKYISCSETHTTYKTIKKIFNLNISTQEALLKKTIEMLKKDPKILIFDEVDKIKNFSQLINDLNTIYRKTMVPIILITPKRDIIKQMPQDARKTLFFDKITLPAYKANELRSILESRIKSISIEITNLDKGTMNYISAIAAQHGSARVLMNITLRCIQKNNFTQKFIEQIFKEMMKEDWLDFINDINQTEKEFLRVLLRRCDYENETASEQIQKDMGLTPARISQLINTFERYSAITSRHENRGRAGGRRRFVKFVSKEIFEELNKIESY